MGGRPRTRANTPPSSLTPLSLSLPSILQAAHPPSAAAAPGQQEAAEAAQPFQGRYWDALRACMSLSSVLTVFFTSRSATVQVPAELCSADNGRARPMAASWSPGALRVCGDCRSMLKPCKVQSDVIVQVCELHHDHTCRPPTLLQARRCTKGRPLGCSVQAQQTIFIRISPGSGKDMTSPLSMRVGGLCGNRCAAHLVVVPQAERMPEKQL